MHLALLASCVVLSQLISFSMSYSISLIKCLSNWLMTKWTANWSGWMSKWKEVMTYISAHSTDPLSKTTQIICSIWIQPFAVHQQIKVLTYVCDDFNLPDIDWEEEAVILNATHSSSSKPTVEYWEGFLPWADGHRSWPDHRINLKYTGPFLYQQLNIGK